MLKVEKLDFISLGLNTIETFRSMCEWIGTAMINAENYQTVKKGSIVNPESNLMTHSFFERQSKYMESIAKRVGFDLTLLIIKHVDNADMDEAERAMVGRMLSESVKKVLRSIDLAFDYQETGGQYSILLPATNEAGANIVRDKIAKDLDAQMKKVKQDINFSYIVQGMHAAA